MPPVLAAVAGVGAVAGWVAHRRAVEGLRGAVRREREWSRRLSSELHEQVSRSGPVGDADDVRDLLLRTAMGLLDARKGVLLSRTDADGDGDFDMISAHGFDRDPEHLPVVQRFTSRVLARDETVREDNIRDDGEIENLVAVPVYLFDRFHGVVICANRAGGFGSIDDNVLLALGDHAGAALHSQRLQRTMRDTHRGAVQMLGELLATHDPARGSAAAEGALLTAALARRLRLEPKVRDVAVCAAALRDIGLLAVPETILAKAAPLDPGERAVVQRHPQVGFDVIGRVGELRDVGLAVLYHHERHDGQGYPARLAGDAIPVAARLVAVADAYCAMTRERPYRPARSPEAAVRELIAHAGTQFDPDIVAVFVEELEHPQVRRVDAGTAEAMLEWLVLPDRAETRDGREAQPPGIDWLTQLGGHRAFHEAAAAAAARDTPFAVLLLELDGLPAVNERDGYAAGDRQIADAGRRLQRVAARLGLIAYRDGGARLGVVAPGYGVEAARQLLDAINGEFAVDPPVRLAAAVRRTGQDGDAVIAAARRDLHPVTPAAFKNLGKVD